jgi:DNA topoisomerase IA
MTLKYRIKTTGFDFSGMIPCRYYEIDFTYNNETKMLRVNTKAIDETKTHKEFIQMIKKNWNNLKSMEADN